MIVTLFKYYILFCLYFSFIPIFTQVFQSWQNCYIGIRIDEDGFRVDYQMIHLGKVPSKFHYFSGILTSLRNLNLK